MKMFAPAQKMRSFRLVMTTRAHLGMFEADALDGIRELDVDAEIVRIELQAVVGREPAVFLHVHRQRRDGAVERQLPVQITRGIPLEVDGRRRRTLARELHGARVFLGLEAVKEV